MLIAASILKYLPYKLIVLFFWIRFMHRHATREDAAFCSTSGKELLIVEEGSCTSMAAYLTLQIKACVQNLQAGCGCRGLGARSSLPHRTDPRLAGY